MFFVDCPRFQGFMTWDELGSLARAVGFPTDLFKSNVTKHVTAEEHGMSVEQVNRMLDLRLLQKSIHRTRNLHTGEWNTKVIRKALFLMDHHALTFEELYNIRIAYKAFEGNDMRGMALDERVMLSALKMCGRSIAPLKMMHRIKHMSVNFEEPDRMQLFEFLDLVLWAGVYEEFSEKSMEKAEGKEGDLFKLVDFDLLLSHHDKKLADRLNQEYLEEEWDFGHETLTKGKFKEPPVVCGESRMQMSREQKLKFRYLKSELVKSHSKLYRAKAGYIRDRPITAPDLSMYKEEEAAPPQQEFTAQDAYQIVQRKIKSANASLGRTRPDLSDKPDIPHPQTVWMAKAVSEEEIEETQKKYDDLKFDIETVKGRFDYQKEKEIEFYFPGQLDRLTKKQEEKEGSLADMKKSSHTSSKQTLTQTEVNRLAYPLYQMPPSHAKACDARFRGWHNVKKKKGSHYVLVAPTYDNSVHGRLYKKLVETSNAQVKKVKGDFVHRFTKRSEVQNNVKDTRPFTAPANIQSSDSELENEAAVGVTQSPSDSNKTVDTGYGSMEEKIGEGSSAESLAKSPDPQTVKPEESQRGFPRPFETNIIKSDHSCVENNSSSMKESKNISNSEKQFLSSGPRAKTDITIKVSDNVNSSEQKRPKTSISRTVHQQNNSSSQKERNNKGSIGNGFNRGHHTDIRRTSSNSVSSEANHVDLNTKVENLKKDLNKHATEKRVANNQKHSAKSPPPLEFKFSSISTYSDEEDDDYYVPPVAKSNKILHFDGDYSSPISTPRTPEPTFYTKSGPGAPEPKIIIKPKKEVIDIENMPVPQLQYSKPKTVSVGAIGKISLLESITESRFWEEVVEESYKRPSIDEVFIPNEKLNPEGKELEDLKEDVEDDASSDSGYVVKNERVKNKPKSEPKFKGPVQNIDDKLTKAKMERLKRQKRVLKSSSTFEKLGISVAKPTRTSKLSTSSDTSNKGTLTKDTANNKKLTLTSKEQLKNDKNSNKNLTQEISKDEKENINKTDVKQKKFCDSMKRLVNRMDESLSADMRKKMLSTRLTQQS